VYADGIRSVLPPGVVVGIPASELYHAGRPVDGQPNIAFAYLPTLAPTAARAPPPDGKDVRAALFILFGSLLFCFPMLLMNVHFLGSPDLRARMVARVSLLTCVLLTVIVIGVIIGMVIFYSTPASQPVGSWAM